ncbi:MAG: glycoside hydrolase family 3 C-terminal domain-containing protein [Halanaerobiaceae bacterium]
MKEINILVNELTLEEKASLCSGASRWSTKPIERLGIPHMNLFDGPHGLRGLDKIDAFDIPNRPGTCFPTASALASSWNRDLIREVGHALAEEAKDHNVHVLLGPGVNIKRHPLGGRNFEYFSEDPYLAGEMAANYINSVQENGVGTSLKHFTANNQEYERFSISAGIDERTLREIYLPAFEKAVKEAQPWTVMCAYNKINGVFGSEHTYLLNDILRKEWGFKGIVVSDWWATHDRIKGIMAGLDLEMPGSSPVNDQKIVEAVQEGRLDEKVLNTAVRRILELIEKAEKYRVKSSADNSDTVSQGETNSVDYEKHHELAAKTAAESIVLLKNDNNLLPINIDDIDGIAVIGKMAVEPRYQGAGSSRVRPTKLSIPLDELKRFIDGNEGNVEVKYTVGYDWDEQESKEGLSNKENIRDEEKLLNNAVKLAESVDRAIIFAGVPENIESEGYDRNDMKIPRNQIDLIKAILDVQPNTIIVLNNGAAVEMREWIDKAPAVLEAWLTGQAGADAVVDILFGKVNPSGKLSETFPVKLADTPAYINYPGENGVVRYGEGIFVGYRYYDSKGIEPEFPFGHGLSYTDFKYKHLQIDRVEDDNNYIAEVELQIENIGELAGKEVVQLYIGQNNSTVSRPLKELKGFKKIYLEPGERRKIKFKLSYRDFSYYNSKKKKWIAENDIYNIFIGSSSRDIRLNGIFKLEDGEEKGLNLSKDTPTLEWLKDRRGREIISQVLSKQKIELLESKEYIPIADKPIYRLNAFSYDKITSEEVSLIFEKAEISK